MTADLPDAASGESGDRHHSEEAYELLVEAGRVLASSLDYEATIQAAANLFIPRLADWCVIYVRDEDGAVRAVGIAHPDPARVEEARRTLARYPSSAALPTGPGRVIATGKPELVQSIPDPMLDEIAQDAEHRDALRRSGIRASMTVPLIARDRTLGAISFISAESGRRYEPEDLALAEELGRRAAVAIDNARLYTQAQAAIRARDDVLGVVAHDLRNPLNTIGLAVQLLAMTDMPEDQRQKHYATIQRSTDRMNRLIQDLLDVAILEAGRLNLTREPVETAPLLEEVREMFAAHTEEKGQTLEFELATTLPALHADRGRVLQVLGNLIGNAIKFTPEGGRITVRAQPAAEGVRFDVSDTGPGISADELRHIFERFWQSKATRRGGAGLGLAIARGIVDVHGGTIHVESAPGEGTTFAFTIPAVTV